MNEEEIRSRNAAVRKAVEKALDEYLLEGPENDDRWSERTVQELTEDFGTYLNIGVELNAGWLNEQNVLTGGWFSEQDTNKLRAFRDREGDIWVQVESTADEYICVTDSNFPTAARTTLGLVPCALEQIEAIYGPVKEI
jgi:hypothetical protein